MIHRWRLHYLNTFVKSLSVNYIVSSVRESCLSNGPKYSLVVWYKNTSLWSIYFNIVLRIKWNIFKMVFGESVYYPDEFFFTRLEDHLNWENVLTLRPNVQYFSAIKHKLDTLMGPNITSLSSIASPVYFLQLQIPPSPSLQSWFYQSIPQC